MVHSVKAPGVYVPGRWQHLGSGFCQTDDKNGWRRTVIYRDPLLKCHTPGGDWHPGWGIDHWDIISHGTLW